MEYKVIHVDTVEGLEELLNEYGAEGWTICKYHEIIYQEEWRATAIIFRVKQ